LNENLTDFDLVIHLAAEHGDDVSPTSLYYDVNVDGMHNILEAMDRNGISDIIFTSSVAIYGINKENPDEGHPADPFSHYGSTTHKASLGRQKQMAGTHCSASRRIRGASTEGIYITR